MTEKRLTVAVVGTGMIAQAGHLPAWKNLPEEIEVKAAVDVVRERAETFAKAHDLPKAYDDIEQMLTEIQPDIVSVCTPSAFHKNPVVSSLKAGAHVLCEKPVATSYEDASEMFDAAKQADRMLMIGQSSRFRNKAMAAKAMIDAGKLGDIYYAETCAMRRRGIPKWGKFHMKEHSGGGPIYDLGVHTLDLLLWLMGNPTAHAVSSMTYTKFGNRNENLVTSLADSGAPAGVRFPRKFDCSEFNVEDMASGFIRLENDITIGFKVSWAANIPENTARTMILGTDGGIQLNPFTLVTNVDGYQVNVNPKVPKDRNVPFAGHWSETAHFVKTIRGSEELIVKPDEVLNVMRILDGLYRSAAEGREIELSS